MDVHPIKNGIFIGIDPYPCQNTEKYLRLPQPWDAELASHQAIIVHDTRYGGHHLSPRWNHSTSTSLAPCCTVAPWHQCPVHPHRYKAAVYVSQLQIHLEGTTMAGYGRLVIERRQSWHWAMDCPSNPSEKYLGNPSSFLSPFVCCVEVASILTDNVTTSASALWDMLLAEPGVSWCNCIWTDDTAMRIDLEHVAHTV